MSSTSTDQTVQIPPPNDNNAEFPSQIINQPYNNWETSSQYSSDFTAPPPSQIRTLPEHSAHGPLDADVLGLPAYPELQQFTTSFPQNQLLYQYPTRLSPQHDNDLQSTVTFNIVGGLPPDTQPPHPGPCMKFYPEEHNPYWWSNKPADS